VTTIVHNHIHDGDDGIHGGVRSHGGGSYDGGGDSHGDDVHSGDRSDHSGDSWEQFQGHPPSQSSLLCLPPLKSTL